MSTQKKGRRPNDPHAEREAAKYTHPVPSREAILGCLSEADARLTREELMARLGVSGERDEESFRRRLRAMERDGQLHYNRRGRYGLIDRLDMITGHVIGHPDGFGFLAPDDNSGDLFLSAREMKKALHGDRVMGQVTGTDQRGRREGMIVEVLEHRHERVVGRFYDDAGFLFVTPEDKRLARDILIPEGGAGGATGGEIVEVEITQYAGPRQRLMGRVIKVLGAHMAPGMEIDIAIRKFELPHVFDEAVIADAGQYGDQVPETAKTTSGRRDLRQLPLVTIDGEDARDFDDAVYAARDKQGFRLTVAIADVSYYVKPGSPLDEEAYRRGTSVYFPDRVIPMLPEALSNTLCSLMPKVDRLCMVCEMRISPKGEIKSYEFYEGVMRSAERLTYNKVAAILVDGDKALRSQYAHVIDELETLYDLYKVLNAVRQRRGAVDFEIPETKIIFDENRKIERIVGVERNDAHKLIEECMLAANVCAAEFLAERKIPTPYRVHAGPTEEKLDNLRSFLFEFGLELGGGDKPTAMDYAEVLGEIAGRADARLIQTVMLRSLSQAIYSPDNIGHFALSYASYAHFTSPIRRYPDLMVHRAIKHAIRNKTGTGRVSRALGKILGRGPSRELMEAVKTQSEHCSMTGRRADEAVWDVLKWLKTEYMQDRVGEDFEGLVTGVTNFGVFVELKDTAAEGLIHISALGDDYYHFEPEKHRLTGERTGQMIRLGDAVLVRVARVDLDEAKIDLELLETTHTPRKRGPKKDKGKGGKRSKGGASQYGKKKGGGKQAKKKSANKKTSKKKAAKKKGKKSRRSRGGGGK